MTAIGDVRASIKLGPVQSADAVIEFTDAIDLAIDAGPDPNLALDFSNLTGSDVRVAPQWGAVLGNVMAARLSDTPLHVTLPQRPAAQLQLARAGVLFALARNRHLDRKSLRGGYAKLLRAWERDWQPRAVQQALFAYPGQRDGEDSPAPLDRDLVAFLNPDRAPQRTAVADQKPVVQPWLRDLAGYDETGRSKIASDLLQQVSLVCQELLDNIRMHSGVTDGGLSSIALFATNGSSDHDLLYLTVFDTGVGMPATLPGKFPEPTDMTTMVAAPFNGDLPTRARDRGRGLNRVASLLTVPNSKLFVATGPYEGGAVVIEHEGGSSVPIGAVSQPGVKVQGTVVVVTIPVPRQQRPQHARAKR